jgi:hypothetical protein
VNALIDAILHPIVGILRKLALLAKDLDYGVIRALMVIIYPLFG